METTKLNQLYAKLVEKHGKESEEAIMLKEILIAEDNCSPRGGIRPIEFTGKDPWHPITEGVFYDCGHIVATDSHALIDITGQSYPAEYEGKAIGKDGREIEGNFPRWRSVMPDESTTTELRPDWDELTRQYKEVTLGLKSKTSTRNYIDFGPFAIKHTQYKKLLGLLKSPGIDKVLYRSECVPVLFTGPNYRLIVMPVPRV